MKKILFTLIISTFILSSRAQTADTAKNRETDTTVYTPLDHPDDSLLTKPEYPGGLNSMANFLGRTIRYPAVAREKNQQGRVIVQMIIEKDGSVSSVRIFKSVCEALDKEALRVTWLMPKWTPGTYKGRPVRSLWKFPMGFMLSTD